MGLQVREDVGNPHHGQHGGPVLRPQQVAALSQFASDYHTAAHRCPPCSGGARSPLETMWTHCSARQTRRWRRPAQQSGERGGAEPHTTVRLRMAIPPCSHRALLAQHVPPLLLGMPGMTFQ